jgi:hypothetical protein
VRDDVDDPVVEELHLVETDCLVPRGTSALDDAVTARIVAPPCETTWPTSKRSSTAGLTINARRPAISARRRRRISSSLLPQNIGPHTTSSDP